ncbi:MAG: hypothetical protein GX554_01680 [Elusimicrobia bacterium]|nr:hypothetical protein [Elusimicrobiota bacterium]
MKTLWTFPCNYKNKTDLLIKECIKEPSVALYITPNISKVRDFKLKYHQNRPDMSLLPSTYTIKTLALDILNSESEKRIISDVEKFINILQLLKDNGVDKSFRYALPGMALAILHFIRDAKISTEGTVSAQDIRKRVEEFEWKFDYNRSVLQLALDIMEKYIKYMERHGFLDMEDIYKESVKHIAHLEFQEILFDGFCEIPYYQREFIKSIIKQSPSTVFLLSHDSETTIDVRELILNNTYSWLKKICNWQEKKFGHKERKSDVKCYNFASQEEEVEGIVKLIVKMLEQHPDWTLNDIMAVFPSMPSYRSVVQRIFRRYNLPCEILPGYSLAQDSSISTILELSPFMQSYDWGTLMNILLCPYFTELNQKDSQEISLETRERFNRRGFIKDDFVSLKGRNIEIIKKALKRIEGSPKTLKKWVKDMEFVIKTLGWQPCYPEIKVRFQKLLHEIGKDGVFSENEFVNILQKTMELVDVEEGRGVGIKVSGVQESVGLDKKLCIVGGATESNIPGIPSLEELFLPDTLKKELGFTDYTLRMARERLDLYRLKNESENVIFTYPSKVQSENQMKSILLFDLKDSLKELSPFILEGNDIFDAVLSREKFNKRFVKDGILKINVSQLESFLRCPYSFYLQYVEKAIPYQQPQIAEVPDLWGKIIHDVMKTLFNGYENRTLQDKDISKLTKLFKEGVEQEIENKHSAGEISGFYKNILTERTEEVVNKFIAIINAHKEYEFIKSESDISVNIPNLIIKGRIDRIERAPSGKINIVDIKTGTAQPPSYTELDFFKGNVQIPLYIWMYSRINNISPNNIQGNIWRFSFKEDNEKSKDDVFYESSKIIKYFDMIEGYLKEITQKLLHEPDVFTPDKVNCFVCQYKGICPYER